MSGFIQSLESRVFLSVSSTTLSTDLSAVRSTSATLQKDAGTGHATLAADLSALAKDVRALKVSSNNKLLATLGADNARGQAKATVARAQLIGTADALSGVLSAEGKLLLLKPTNTKLASKVSTDAGNLTSKVSPKVSALQTAEQNWQTSVAADLNTIDTANASSTTVHADVIKAQSDLAAAVATSNTDASALNSAVATLAADASAIA